ncbi:hypothetical protein N9R72_00765 [Flavobacteriaceae bacterium]|nr:hypothetical protein [Flavobacteriaceae bacterium]
MGLFDFFRKAKPKGFTDEEIEEMDKKHSEMCDKLEEIDKYFLKWELMNDGDISTQIDFFAKQFGRYLELIDLQFRSDMFYIQIYKYCHQDYRDSFSNERELGRDWCRGEWNLVVRTIYDLFETFEQNLSEKGIKHNDTIWKNPYTDEVVKECQMFDPLLITKLKAQISGVLKMLKDSHRMAMNRYKNVSDKGLVPIGEYDHEHWQYRHLDDPIYFGGEGTLGDP